MEHLKKYGWIYLGIIAIIILFVPKFKITTGGCGLAPGSQTFKNYNLATILLYGGELGCGLRSEIY